MLQLLSFALHNNNPNLLSLDAFYDLKMRQNAFADGAPPGPRWRRSPYPRPGWI